MDCLDARVRVGTAQEGGFLRPWEFEIGNELAFPMQVTVVFLSKKPRSDAEF
jgi:hypothetical protein